MVYVEIGDIGPDRLDEEVSVTATKDGQSQTVSYSPMCYIVRMCARGNGALNTLLTALYNYHLAAKEL
jgi:hypothetical protein